MKTKNPHVELWRQNHHAALKKLAAPECKLTGLQIWRKLRRLEAEATRITTALCNGEIEESMIEEAERSLRFIEHKVEAIFGRRPEGFFINRDPRGSALRLDGECVVVPAGMWKNWGGDGVLAADIN